jgi:hypothetical protein
VRAHYTHACHDVVVVQWAVLWWCCGVAGAPADVVQGVETEMASLALDWCGLQLQSGHSERGVAGIQALLEYHLFEPEGEGLAGGGFECVQAGADIWVF